MTYCLAIQVAEGSPKHLRKLKTATADVLRELV